MDILVFVALAGLSFGLLFLPKTVQSIYHLLLQLGIIGISSYWAVETLLSQTTLLLPLPIALWGKPLLFTIDSLSAFFILIINFALLMGSLYARGYLRPYQATKSATELGWHHLLMWWLHAALLMVVMFRSAFEFLMVWEVMSIASFFLVLFESENKDTVKIGLRYLIQMHIGMVFVLIGFLVAYAQTGGVLGFDGLSAYFEQHHPLLLFSLFFIGFGVKAGFVPFHSWLPQAHPAAPSHVSGMMSGVMIKAGIYGILRVLLQINAHLFSIGLLVLAVSLITGLYGIMNAIMRKDTKKILAFSSIENIGIIGIGIGASLVGKALGINDLAVLALAGSLLHILNHSLFKSLLFFSAGSIYQQTHSRYIEQMGGLIKKMPKTGYLMLIGSLAICGLPPFNGFVSEFLIYAGLFHGLQSAGMTPDLVILASFTGLALIGGLAIFCFTRMYSVIFLGSPRHERVSHAHEVEGSMLLPKIILVMAILVVGMSSFIIMPVIELVVKQYNPDTFPLQHIMPSLIGISIAGGSLVVLIGLILWMRSRQQQSVLIERNLPWGCGYQYHASDVPIHQYTATSYAENFRELVAPIVGEEKPSILYAEDEIFPQPRSFRTETYDKVEKALIEKPSEKLLEGIEYSAVFQTGQLQHYVLFALAFMAGILVLSVLNLI